MLLLVWIKIHNFLRKLHFNNFQNVIHISQRCAEQVIKKERKRENETWKLQRFLSSTKVPIAKQHLGANTNKLNLQQNPHTHTETHTLTFMHFYVLDKQFLFVLFQLNGKWITRTKWMNDWWCYGCSDTRHQKENNERT